MHRSFVHCRSSGFRVGFKGAAMARSCCSRSVTTLVDLCRHRSPVNRRVPKSQSGAMKSRVSRSFEYRLEPVPASLRMASANNRSSPNRIAFGATSSESVLIQVRLGNPKTTLDSSRLFDFSCGLGCRNYLHGSGLALTTVTKRIAWGPRDVQEGVPAPTFSIWHPPECSHLPDLAALVGHPVIGSAPTGTQINTSITSGFKISLHQCSRAAAVYGFKRGYHGAPVSPP